MTLVPLLTGDLTTWMERAPDGVAPGSTHQRGNRRMMHELAVIQSAVGTLKLFTPWLRKAAKEDPEGQ